MDSKTRLPNAVCFTAPVFSRSLFAQTHLSHSLHTIRVRSPSTRFRHARAALSQHEEQSPPPAPPSVPLPVSPVQTLVQCVPVSVQNASLLALVPFLWGSYGVAVKFLFSSSTPMPLSLLNLSSFVFAFVSLLLPHGIVLASSARKSGPFPPFLPTFAAGAELGIYLYFGAVLNLEALQRTSASRTAFLVQLTTVFVPLANALMGETLQPQVVAACVMVVLGGAVLSQSGEAGVGAMMSPLVGGLNGGDWLAIASAILYSVHVLRLDRTRRKEAGTLVLLEGKIVMQLALSSMAVLFAIAHGDSSVIEYMGKFRELPLLDKATAIWWSAWIGVGTTALATWAQIVGQERMGANRTAVFYASQPVWGAGLACLVGLDQLSKMELIGGGLIVAAGGLLAVADRRGNEQV